MVRSHRRGRGGAARATAAGRLARSLERGEGGPYAVDEAARLPGVVYAALFVDDAGRLVPAARTPAASLHDLPPAVARRAVATAAPVRDENVLAWPIGPVGGSSLAVLVLGLRREVGDELSGPLAEIAEVAAALLENERRLRASIAEARQDPLTGLRNRRGFAEHLELLLAAEASVELAVVFCDLDDFKSVNDRQGYTAGDEVLREVARVLSAGLRPGEELFRIGGDEFALVVLGSRAVADVVALRLASVLATRRRGPELPALSTGVAVFPADGRTDEELVGSAARTLIDGRRRRREGAPPALAPPARRLRLLAVDDDAALRLLLRTTFELADISVEEAESAEEAREAIRRTQPDVVVLDVSLPGAGGLDLTRELKANPATAGIAVVLLTGGDTEPLAARAAGANALVRKPFSPLELLAAVERATGTAPTPRSPAVVSSGSAEDQLLLYAGDLRRLLELERRQRRTIESAYRETVGALAGALEIRDTGTGAHSLRVQRYASELAAAAAPGLLEDTSVEYGFLLHDIGKIGIPDSILQKPGPLSDGERRIMQMHAPVGAQMLAEIGRLRGEGLAIVRHHHERWDGAGYPDELAGRAIPLGARIFAVADALDAMTSDRPYRRAGTWERAVAEIRGETGRQFDPTIVAAFRERESRLRQIHGEFAAA